MSRIFPKLLPCFALLILSNGGTANAETPVSNGGAQEQVTTADLIQRLEHPDFAQREAAGRQLQLRGSEVIPDLLDAAAEQPPEAATRSLRILENLLLSEDRQVYEVADDGLSELSAGDHGKVVMAATEILSRHRTLREERAVAAIQELGGSIQFDLAEDDPANGGAMFLGEAPEQSGPPKLVPSTIALGTKWKGGVEGLKYLRWLGHRNQLTLYVIRGCDVSIKDAQSLAAVLPNLMVNERGPFLGLRGHTQVAGVEHCIVEGVQPDGPADKAGLMTNDVILKLEDQPINTFQGLIEQLKPREVGDEVVLTIVRPGHPEEMKLQVTLGEWTWPELSPEAQQKIREAEARKRFREQSTTNPIPLFER